MQTFHSLVVTGVLLMSMTAAVWAQSPRPREGDLQVGQVAPDFTVTDVHGVTTVRLSDLRGRPVVLIFGSCT